MELVRGIPITDYCDQAKLPVPERLALFVSVCRAVQHVHQKGVIHRDLKPSNVPVTVIDGRSVPEVIDFGIAKATGAALTDRSLYTGFHQLVGTPLYMSSEQAELSGVDVEPAGVGALRPLDHRPLLSFVEPGIDRPVFGAGSSAVRSVRAAARTSAPTAMRRRNG